MGCMERTCNDVQKPVCGSHNGKRRRVEDVKACSKRNNRREVMMAGCTADCEEDREQSRE